MRLGKMTIILTILCLLAITAGAGFASNTARARVSLRIIGGDLSINATDIDFPALDLRNGKAEVSARNNLTVSDPTGTRAGWHVSARAEDLVAGNGSRIPLEKTNFFINPINDSQIQPVKGARDKSPKGIGAPVKLAYEDQKILVAEKMQGMGSFNITPSYSISVPDDSPTGDYTSQVTYTIMQGP